jgi:hypothetical protein
MENEDCMKTFIVCLVIIFLAFSVFVWHLHKETCPVHGPNAKLEQAEDQPKEASDYMIKTWHGHTVVEKMRNGYSGIMNDPDCLKCKENK